MFKGLPWYHWKVYVRECKHTQTEGLQVENSSEAKLKPENGAAESGSSIFHE